MEPTIFANQFGGLDIAPMFRRITEDNGIMNITSKESAADIPAYLIYRINELFEPNPPLSVPHIPQPRVKDVLCFPVTICRSIIRGP